MKVDLEKYGLRPRVPEVFDSSMIKDFVDCPSMFYLRHILGLKKNYFDQEDQAKFDWGTCWHSGLEAYWRDPDMSPENRIVAGITAIDLNYPTYITPETDRFKRSKDRMIKAFFEYFEHWKTQDAEYKVLRTEQYFNVYSEELDFDWCGRKDGIRVRVDTGEWFVWDYKTASRMGKNYFDQHELGFQFPGYVWAANELTTHPITKITVDVFYMITASHSFHRRTFRFIPERINEWLNNVKRIVDQIRYLAEHHLYDPAAWVQNRNECTRYGRCAYFDVHSIAPIGDTRLRILSTDYHEERWDPAHAVEEGDEE